MNVLEGDIGRYELPQSLCINKHSTHKTVRMILDATWKVYRVLAESEVPRKPQVTSKAERFTLSWHIRFFDLTTDSPG